MKKFLSEMKWNDRTKLALAALATGAVLLFSMLFPLAFRSRVTAEPDDGFVFVGWGGDVEPEKLYGETLGCR